MFRNSVGATVPSHLLFDQYRTATIIAFSVHQVRMQIPRSRRNVRAPLLVAGVAVVLTSSSLVSNKPAVKLKPTVRVVSLILALLLEPKYAEGVGSSDHRNCHFACLMHS